MKRLLVDGLVDKGEQNGQQEVLTLIMQFPCMRMGKKGSQEQTPNFTQWEQQMNTVFKQVPQYFIQRAAYSSLCFYDAVNS
jgi:hypothetical protein